MLAHENFPVGATKDAMCGARCSNRRPLCSEPMTCFRTMMVSHLQKPCKFLDASLYQIEPLAIRSV